MLDASWFNQFSEFLAVKRAEMRSILDSIPNLTYSQEWGIFVNSYGKMGFIVPCNFQVQYTVKAFRDLIESNKGIFPGITHIAQYLFSSKKENTNEEIQDVLLYSNTHRKFDYRTMLHDLDPAKSLLMTFVDNEYLSDDNDYPHTLRIEFLSNAFCTLSASTQLYCNYLNPKSFISIIFNKYDKKPSFSAYADVYPVPSEIMHEIYLDNKGKVSVHSYLYTCVAGHSNLTRTYKKYKNTLRGAYIRSFYTNYSGYNLAYNMGIEVSNSQETSYAYNSYVDLKYINDDDLVSQYILNKYLQNHSGTRKDIILELIKQSKETGLKYIIPTGETLLVNSEEDIAGDPRPHLTLYKRGIINLYLREDKPEYIKNEISFMPSIWSTEELAQLGISEVEFMQIDRCKVCGNHTIYRYKEGEKSIHICSKKCLDRYLQSVNINVKDW